MVYRIYSEKKPGVDVEARKLFSELREILKNDRLKSVRILNRYDVENISEELFRRAVGTVFSEPQLDVTYDELPQKDGKIIAVEYLPGQFDMRADSASQCIGIMSEGERPAVRTAKVYIFGGELSRWDVRLIKKHIINPVESREAKLTKPKTLSVKCEIPEKVKTVYGFRKFSELELYGVIKEFSLAMDRDDLMFCQDYFRKENRDPTITEIRMIDTYWSDHCRHTTFLTTIDSAEIEDEEIRGAYDKYISVRESVGRKKPINLMDIATIAVKRLKADGLLSKLDESEEINACTVKIDVETDGKCEKWLLLFKNETHNHPTEIEPFGGAATCIGGAIRDPLSGRAYVYQAMRVTGAGNPLPDGKKTLRGKLPQRKIVTTAANGYSSYGNQIGLATGLVDEIYHDGYIAKRMEIGAVIGAVPAENVRREVPDPGDVVILLGGRTGRDGCGGATGSSKSHKLSSLKECGAEVQKGNAPEERKLQRLFRNPAASRLIKRCNDFGAGGVSVAVGELADGLDINLDAVPKKYEGLDGTELAISESQERMAVVVESGDCEKFCRLANEENLEATVVARVTDKGRLTMNWNGKTIVDLSREFLNSNGAEKHIKIKISKPRPFEKKTADGSFKDKMKVLAADLNVCSKRGLSERFDSTIGAGSVLMPFGGKYQLTPTQSMAAKIPVLGKNTETCSVMAYGYNPFITEKSPYHGAYLAVVESVAKLAAAGAPLDDCYLTFQEYFEKPGVDPYRWGKPAAALLGAMKAQLDLGFAAIGGKDSMSGSFEKIDVPPTLVSFAVTVGNAKNIISPEFKKSGSEVLVLRPEYDENGIPKPESFLALCKKLCALIADGHILSCFTPTYGGIAEAVMKMCFGNKIGFEFSGTTDIFSYAYGSFVVETDGSVSGEKLGVTASEAALKFGGEKIMLDELSGIYEGRLEPVFPLKTDEDLRQAEVYNYSCTEKFSPKIKVSKPKAVIPVFPGTNCEYDTARRFRAAGAEAEIIVINNLSPKGISESVSRFADAVEKSQIVFIPGGFSGGDEPEGSGKFITAFFRNPLISEKVNELLCCRDGLMAGICNGFQALIKLGLVPFGEIRDADKNSPTLTFNTIARHQSKLVRTRVASNKSPWLSKVSVGDVYTVPVSHGEGRFVCSPEILASLAKNGQIATQYADLSGQPSYDISFNPNGSVDAVEGILSPDGRIFGKMGHSERIGTDLYKNVPGDFDMKLFESAVEYFK